jgi:hypothetical protein
MVHELRGWRRWLLVLLAWIFRLWARSLRYEISDEVRRTILAERGNCLLLMWHNRLFVCPEMYRRMRQPFQRLHALVSASRDGAWLSGLMAQFGVIPVRGSSSRRGAAAARALVELAQRQGDVGITVDGPRGPRYTVHPGAALVAAKAAVPVIFFNAVFQRAWRLNSWDGFYIPLPFSRVRVLADRMPPLPAGTDRQMAQQHIEAWLQALRVAAAAD